MTDYTPKFIKRFYAKISQTNNADECWNWIGAISSSGYGNISTNGGRKSLLVHRVAYELANKTDPGEFEVCHDCDNPICCNPKHLFLGTHEQNMQDRFAKGRYRKQPRNSVINDTDKEAIKALYSTKRFTQKQIADLFKIGLSTVERYLSESRNTI